MVLGDVVGVAGPLEVRQDAAREPFAQGSGPDTWPQRWFQAHSGSKVWQRVVLELELKVVGNEKWIKIMFHPPRKQGCMRFALHHFASRRHGKAMQKPEDELVDRPELFMKELEGLPERANPLNSCITSFIYIYLYLL